MEEVPAPEQNERDTIFSLLIYALVLKDWQAEEIPWQKRRGYNIGALLVDTSDTPVYHGLNFTTLTNNATQHGEVRAITQYLEKAKRFDLAGFTVYTTLEPCIMCAGMITMTSCKRVVFGQNDVFFSRSFERIQSETGPVAASGIYPRKVITRLSNLSVCKKLNDACKLFYAMDSEKILAKFLASQAAKQIYEEAKEMFIGYQIIHSSNQTLYKASLDYYHTSKTH